MVTPHLMRKISTKNRLFNGFIADRKVRCPNIFKNHINKLNAELKFGKINYYNKRFLRAVGKYNHDLWKHFNNSLNPAKQTPFKEIHINGQAICGQKWATTFND